MNSAKKILHRVVIELSAEEFFIKLRQRVNVVRKFVPVSLRHQFASVGKFVPHSSSYPKDDSYFLTRDNTAFKINRSDYVQWRIFYGVRDNALAYAKKCMTADSIVLDIGANCGGFSLKLAMHAAQYDLSNLVIHAFEPNPFILEKYLTNLELNPSASEIVQVHPIGLGNETGERPFHFPDTNTGVGRVLMDGSNAKFSVKIQRLDDFAPGIGPSKIVFIKMIVEGFEPEVFKGGWATIKKDKPSIFFEATPEWYRENNSSLEEILGELRVIGYKFMGEYYNEMIPYDPAKFAAVFQYNILAIPPDN